MSDVQTLRTRARRSSPARGGRPEKAEVVMPPITQFAKIFRADAMTYVLFIKHGVPARTVDVMAKKMDISKEKLVHTLGFVRTTVNRKASEDKKLTSDESARVLGMARLVGQVQAMVEESGDPQGFDAAKWVARWLDRPLPALGGRVPGELMDTVDGQAMLSNLLRRMQHGVYA